MEGLDWEAFIAETARLEELPLRGLRTIVELRETLVRLERFLVVDARRTGSTWEAIGAALGVSRQAAFVRHRPAVNPTDRVRPRPSG